MISFNTLKKKVIVHSFVKVSKIDCTIKEHQVPHISIDNLSYLYLCFVNYHWVVLGISVVVSFWEISDFSRSTEHKFCFTFLNSSLDSIFWYRIWLLLLFILSCVVLLKKQFWSYLKGLMSGSWEGQHQYLLF
jgi:hypothetical protein